MSLIIEDNRENKWSVQEGDPAWSIVSSLEKKGYKWIVLPMDWFVMGKVQTPYTKPMLYQDAQDYFEAGMQHEGEFYVQMAECIDATA
jgi:hypothetical protein